MYCCKRGKDKETNKPLEKVLIPNKYTRETFQIWCACLLLHLERKGDNYACFDSCNIVSNILEMVRGKMMI